MGIEVDVLELSGAERHTVEALALDIDVPVIEAAELYKIKRTQLEDKRDY